VTRAERAGFKTGGIWLATEYIPPTADQDAIDNWGTYMFEVNQFAGL
jgi:hypothetical protein